MELLSLFDYELPEDLIARYPASPRDGSRLLVVDRKSNSLTHAHFLDLPEFLRRDDLLVLNNSKVIPARIFGTSPSGKVYEFLLLEELSSSPIRWSCLVKKTRRALVEKHFRFFDGISATLTSTNSETEITFDALSFDDFWKNLERFGRPPLPPYIKRPVEEGDPASYQTLYASIPGSVAAPTAGLHFTERVFGSLRARGVETTQVTLHVGYGTFAPIKESLDEHVMHTERFELSEDVLSKVANTKKNRGRVFAVGTTSLRALESHHRFGNKGRTNIFIRPPYQFSVVDGLITNFHLPRSTLFVLVCALVGVERTQEIYREAIDKKYRFYSYGDAMLIL